MRILSWVISLFQIIIIKMEDIDSIDPDFMRETKPESSQKSAEPVRLLSLRVEPGFRCFFKEWVDSQKVGIFECYDMILKSHLQLERLRWPAEKIINRDDLGLQEKAQELVSRSTQEERFFVQGRSGVLEKSTFVKEKEEKIKLLEMQVELYRRRREEALEAKREQFRKMAAVQEEALRKVEEEKERRQRVLESLMREKKSNDEKY